MQIVELGVGESAALAADVRVTVLEIFRDGVRLQIDAPAHVLVTIGDPPNSSTGMPEKEGSRREGN